MTVAVDAVLEQALEAVIDGRSAMLDAPAGFDFRAAETLARHRGVTVVDVGAADRRGFAMGALLEAVGPVVAEPVATLVAVGASDRLLRWSERQFQQAFSRLASNAPVLLLVPRTDGLDEIGRRWLRSLAPTPRGPVVCVRQAGAVASDVWGAGDLPELPGDAQLLAQLLAVSDLALSVTELAGLSGVAEDAVARELAVLRRQDLVSVKGDLAALSRRSVVRALRDQLGPALSQGLRLDVDSVLRTRSLPNVVLAELAMSSGARVRRDDTDALIRAMVENATDDPEAACDYGLAAVRGIEGQSDLLTAVAWSLLPLLWQTARTAEARDLASRVFTEKGHPEAEAQVLLWLSRLVQSPEEAARMTASALAWPSIPPLLRARLLSVHLRCLSVLGRADEVDELLPDALAVATATGDPESCSRLLACDAIRHFYRGEYARSVELTHRSETEWTRSGRRQDERIPEVIWQPHLIAVTSSPTDGLALLDERFASFSPSHGALGLPLMHAERGQILLAAGRLDEASDEVVLATTAQERTWSDEVAIDDRLRAVTVAVRLKIALHRGDFAEVADVQESLRSATARPGSEAERRLGWWRYLLSEAAAAATGAPVEDPSALGMVSWLDPADEVLMARALLARGHRAPATELLTRARARIQTPGPPLLARALHAHVDGLVHWRAQPLERAVEHWSDLGRPLIAAAARADLGAKLLEDGDVSSGVDLLTRAHVECRDHGAHRDAWRIRWALRTHGHPIATEGDRSEELTPAESKVVERALLGLTVNRIAQDLGLSRHTVSTHLRHVYVKLGINSRVELLAWAQEA